MASKERGIIEMKKPLAEWLKYRFGLDLNYITQMLSRGRVKFKVNGIQTKNLSYSLSQGDIVDVGGKSYEVKWKETTENVESKSKE